MTRAFNFCAGPAALPEEVLKELQEETLDYKNHGLRFQHPHVGTWREEAHPPCHRLKNKQWLLEQLFKDPYLRNEMKQKLKSLNSRSLTKKSKQISKSTTKRKPKIYRTKLGARYIRKLSKTTGKYYKKYL